MRRDVVALAAAFGVQVLAVAAIPAHESLIRAQGRTVELAVDPIDPYDPVRGYHANFTYHGIDPNLAGFDRGAADGASAWVVLRPRAGKPAEPARIVRSPAGGGADPVLRVRYAVVKDTCYDDASKRAGCRKLVVAPDAWYADESAVAAIGSLLRKHQAVAELRVSGDGDASLLRLRPLSARMGP